jgi:hypothetical protein
MITDNRHPDRWGSVPIPERVSERAATKYVVAGECWLSTYSISSHGYAQIGWQDQDKKMRGTTAHRAAWVHYNGPIPVRMTVDHDHDVCGNRPCVRPGHLRLLSNFDNGRRTAGRNWPLGQCIDGHPDSELIVVSGKRLCGSCRNTWQRTYRVRNREKVNESQREYRARNRETVNAKQREYRAARSAA